MQKSLGELYHEGSKQQAQGVAAGLMYALASGEGQQYIDYHGLKLSPDFREGFEAAIEAMASIGMVKTTNWSELIGRAIHLSYDDLLKLEDSLRLAGVNVECIATQAVESKIGSQHFIARAKSEEEDGQSEDRYLCVIPAAKDTPLVPSHPHQVRADDIVEIIPSGNKNLNPQLLGQIATVEHVHDWGIRGAAGALEFGLSWGNFVVVGKRYTGPLP